MQIGDEEQTFVGPVQRTGRIGDKRDAGDDDRARLRRTRKFRIAAGAGLSGRSANAHCIASLINSASASARSVSDASP